MIEATYDLIEKLQNLIGDGAEVSISLVYKHLVVRVHWYKDNISSKYAIPPGIALDVDEGLYLDQMVMGFKRARIDELGKRGENGHG